MTIDNPLIFYAVISAIAVLFISLILVVVLLIRRLRRLKTYLYNDELELSAKIDF